jgi:hypothetical protein
MKDNLEKVLERDAKLTTLENRAGMLNVGVSNFLNESLFNLRCLTNWCITIYNKCK